MRKSGLILFALVAILTSTLNAVVNYNIVDEIGLQGTLMDRDARSIIKPIVVYTNGSQLRIDFNKPFGQLEVTIVNEFNHQVYENNINVTTVTQEFITIGNLAKGNYTIYITNSEGKFVSGDFDIY